MPDDNLLFFGAAWYIVFLFSTTIHEASHALVALKLGDDTAHRGGQVTLDPTPHIMREPFGMVIVPIISYLMSHWMIGWASAPYDPVWAERHPKRAALMAMAGPASNFLLCLLCGLLIRAGILAGWFEAPFSIKFTQVVSAVHEGLPHLFAVLLSIGFSLNLLLFVFNLIPFPPLDGSCIPLLFLPENLADKYTNLMRSPGMSMVGMIIAWQVFGPLSPHLNAIAIKLLYPELSYQ